MPLFSRLPSKKVPPLQGEAGGRGRESEGRSGAGRTGGVVGTVTGFGLVDLSPTRRVIEVSQGGAGIGAALENAVLMFASGHTDAARSSLAESLENDREAQQSHLAWLVLFDLQQRAGDRAGFDEFALLYVVRFERSAPNWDDRWAPAASRPVAAGFASLQGKLTAASGTQLAPLRQAIGRKTGQARLDLSGINGFDDDGARALTRVLGEARQSRFALKVSRPENLRRLLDAATARGRDGGEPAWLLLLELLQWQGEQNLFDERAIDFAVTFEVSPPSWEPPPADAGDAAAAGAQRAQVAAEPTPATTGLAWSGVISGAHPEHLQRLVDYAEARRIIALDLGGVERVDFVAAGACYNTIKTLESRGKIIRLIGASPVIRAMLQLIGIPPGHFHDTAG